MSAIPQLLPQPAPQPSPGACPAPEPSPKYLWIWIVALITVLAAAAAIVHPWRTARPDVQTAIPTIRAVRGILLRTVRLSGTIEARHYADILAPQLQVPDNGRGLVLMHLPSPGSIVKKGDLLAEIDGQAAKDHLDDVEATVSQGLQDLRKLRAQQAAQMEAVEQRVRTYKGVLDKAKQDILGAAVRSRIDQEVLKLAVEEAQAAYDEAAGEVKLTEESQAAAWRVAEMNQEYQVRHRNRHRVDLERLTLRAPMDGQVVMRPIYRNGEQGQVRVGDVLGGGQLFMRVVDTGSLRIETYVNQTESESLRRGQHARIRFDAYPEIAMDGTVEAVGTIAYGSRRMNYYIRQIPVRIAIDDHDPRVVPDLTASADVVVDERDGSIIVPREAVVEESGKTLVFVRQAGAFAPREVEIGMFSNTEAAISAGLDAGEEVALHRPF
jgi:multidrug efflux pump subunit AcrA (membrane-fusion protein)